MAAFVIYTSCVSMKNYSLLGEFQVEGVQYDRARLRATVDKIIRQLPVAYNSTFTQATTRHSYTSDKFHIHFLVDVNYAYSCIAFSHVRTELCYACLERIKEDLDRATQKEMSLFANDTSSKRRVNSYLSYNVNFANDPANSKLLTVKSQVGEMKTIMLNNIDKILDNMETVDSLAVRSEKLHYNGGSFLNKAKHTNNTRMCRVFILILVLLLIAMGVLGVVVLVLYKLLKLE